MPSLPSRSQGMRLSLSTQYDNIPDIDQVRDRNDKRLKNRFESIFNKYERDFSDVGDVIDLERGEIIVDNGHLGAMRDERDTGSRRTGSRRVILGPNQTDRDELSSTVQVADGPQFQNNYFPTANFPQVTPFNKPQQYTPQMVAMPVMMPTQPMTQFDPAQMQQFIDQRIAEQIEAYHRSRVSHPHSQLRIDNNVWQTPDVTIEPTNLNHVEQSYLHHRPRQSLPCLRRRSFSDTPSEPPEDTVWRGSGHLVSFTASDSESEAQDETADNANVALSDTFVGTQHAHPFQQHTEPRLPRQPERFRSDLPGEHHSSVTVRDVVPAVSMVDAAKRRGRGRPPKKNPGIDHIKNGSALSQQSKTHFRLNEPSMLPPRTKTDSAMRSRSVPNLASTRRGYDSNTEPSPEKLTSMVQWDTARHRRAFTKDEDKLILRLIQEHGLEWNAIAEHFPDRSPRTLYGRWRNHLNKNDIPAPTSRSHPSLRDKPKLLSLRPRRNEDPTSAKTKLLNQYDIETPSLTFPTRTHSPWTTEETDLLVQLRTIDRLSWDQIIHHFPSRSRGCISGHLTHALRIRNSSDSNLKPQRKRKRAAGHVPNDRRTGCDDITLPILPNRSSPLHQQSIESSTTKISTNLNKEVPLPEDQKRVTSMNKDSLRNRELSQASNANFDANASPSRSIGDSNKAVGAPRSISRGLQSKSSAALHPRRRAERTSIVCSDSQRSGQIVENKGAAATTTKAAINEQHDQLEHSSHPLKRKRLSEAMPDTSASDGESRTAQAYGASPQTPRKTKSVKASHGPPNSIPLPKLVPARLVQDDDLGSEDELH